MKIKKARIMFYLIIPIFIGNVSTAFSYPIMDETELDSTNYTDDNNLRQGFWKIFGSMKRMPAYKPDQVIEQGSYTNSAKRGIWTRFFPSGKTKNEITYVKGRQKGAYKTYYQNGQLQEDGYWKNNRNIGKFVRKHENGEMAQEFNFGETGKRTGDQKYYNDQGILIIDAIIIEGKEEKVIEYYDDGSLKAEKNYINGKLDPATTKRYEAKTPIKEKIEGDDKIVKVQPGETTNASEKKEKFSGNGTHKLYNLNKQISKDGFFKNYRLMDGLWYRYNGDGILINVEKYKKGRYIGDAPLPQN